MTGADQSGKTSSSGVDAGFFAVFRVFLKLGLTSFGGPAAHIGFFQDEFVRRRRWLTDAGFSELVALCQLLPGPSSSQAGLAIGWVRGGYPGAIAAWLGFTLPAALVMAAIAFGLTWWPGVSQGGWVAGLKLFVVAVVAQAVWQMGRSLCPDPARLGIAVIAAALILLAGSAMVQVVVLLLAGLLGWRLSLPAVSAGSGKDESGIRAGSRRLSFWFGGVFLGLLCLALIPWATGSSSWLAAEMYRAGALVFGGGHVMVPLLQEGFVGSGYLSADTFLAGYGVAQAVPGPLFSFSAFLGAVDEGGVKGAVIALLAVFLPGTLLVFAALPLWQKIRTRVAARSALAGVNAAVVGLLLAALYDPVWVSAVHSGRGFAFVLVAWAALVLWRLPAWVLAPVCALGGALMF